MSSSRSLSVVVKNLKVFLNRWWAPKVYRNLRISSWKSMMSASTPTLTSLSMIEPNSFIPSTRLTKSHRMTKTMMPIKMLSDRLSFISL